MSQFGYDLATESVNLFLLHEANAYDKIDRKNKEVDTLVTQMENLEKFLAHVTQKTDDSHRLDLSSPEEMKMVDTLRGYGLDHIFPPGTYVWKDEEINNLTQMTHQHIEGRLQRKIHSLTEHMVLEQHELSKTLDIFKNGLTRMNNLTDRILANMARH